MWIKPGYDSCSLQPPFLPSALLQYRAKCAEVSPYNVLAVKLK